MLIICHYGEIGLKGANRGFFEKQLVNNIKKTLGKGCFKLVKRISGRIVIEPEDKIGQKEIVKKLIDVFGVSYFAFTQQAEQGIEKICQKAVEMLADFDSGTFRISTKRSDKAYPLTSQEVNEKVGEAIINKSAKKVSLENFDIELFIEVVDKKAYLYTEKIAGLGGLPVGVSGRAVSLISGGIDSPLASYLAMKRGLELVFIHLFTHEQSIDKVKKQLKLLARFQPTIKTYFVPFLEIQKAIFETQINQEFCCLVCKRIMHRLAEKIAQKENCSAIVNGENLAQVASQTLPNLATIEKAVDLIVLKPLLTKDKQETINQAKLIGSYQISIEPEQSYCQSRLPKHPATSSTEQIVKKQEAKLKVDELIKDAIKKAEIWEIK